jgi:NhaA family Na+:H+ antiporter
MTTARGDDSRSLRLISPLRDFLHTEVAGGVVLVAATVLALVWANSPFRDSYRELWSSVLTLGFPNHALTLTLRGWVNDGLMAIFFLVIGLEIKRELVEGELRDPRKAAIPVAAALGGMLVPALLYLALNAGGPAAGGWGVPIATDTAMALGMISLLGSRAAPPLKLFVLALAIVDDIGAIIVITFFYSRGFNWGSTFVAIGIVLLVLVMRRIGIRATPAYVVIGIGLWLAVYDAGFHATLAGLIMGLLAPTQPFRQEDMIDIDVLVDLSTVEAAEESVAIARESVSVVEWLEHRLHPWSSFLIVPVFALANAGLTISEGSVSRAASSSVTHGIVVGLVVGKLVGISLFGLVAVRLGIGDLPDGMNSRSLVGAAAIGGIGFTMSIFVAGFAFQAPYETDAKIGILVASVTAAAIGALILARSQRPVAADP